MVAWHGTQLSLRSLIESARTVLDLVSTSISVCLVLWVVDAQEAALPLTVSLVHSRSSGWFDGRIKGETPFAASGDHWKLRPCWKLKTISAHPAADWLVSPNPWPSSSSSPSGLWVSPGVHISHICRSDIQDTQTVFIRLSTVCCPRCWPFLGDSLQALGVLISSSFSASSEVSSPLWELFDLLSCFLGPLGGQWVAGV